MHHKIHQVFYYLLSESRGQHQNGYWRKDKYTSHHCKHVLKTGNFINTTQIFSFLLSTVLQALLSYKINLIGHNQHLFFHYNRLENQNNL